MAHLLLLVALYTLLDSLQSCPPTITTTTTTTTPRVTTRSGNNTHRKRDVNEAMSCPPTITTTTTTTTTPRVTTRSGNNTLRKRDVNEAMVTLVSYLDYEPSKNQDYLWMFDILVAGCAAEQRIPFAAELVAGCAAEQRIPFAAELVEKTVINEGGKFAVVYKIWGSDCDEVSRPA
ncbi:unnamed protein product [Strongylus vulgaris]|uniref:Uncharacterized protein n=1 Tax=Strongylus vulgaris TaxID=40348 RepID=A0A3P7JCG6_STRVU|nr:unnamed protein product [Strongylus vulgaris]